MVHEYYLDNNKEFLNKYIQYQLVLNNYIEYLIEI